MASTYLFIGALVRFGVGFAFPKYHMEWGRATEWDCAGRGAGEEKPLGRNLGETSRVGAVFMVDPLSDHVFGDR